LVNKVSLIKSLNIFNNFNLFLLVVNSLEAVASILEAGLEVVPALEVVVSCQEEVAAFLEVEACRLEVLGPFLVEVPLEAKHPCLLLDRVQLILEVVPSCEVVALKEASEHFD
jgi:hypothetical protein